MNCFLLHLKATSVETHEEVCAKEILLQFSFTKPRRGLGGNTCSAHSHTLQQLINMQLRLDCLIVT